MKKTMLRFFAQVLGKGERAAATTAPRDNPATIQEGSESGLRRHLVQVLMRDLLRRHGIPPEWIDCQMMIVSSRSKGSGMYIRLVVKHWDERLLNYANAFQKELLADLTQFEPQAAVWLHGVSWQLEVDGSCPYTALPDRSFWVGQKAGPAASVAAAAANTAAVTQQAPHQAEPVNKEELERLFAIRDREIGEQHDHGLVAAGYEKTQPASL